MSETRKVDALCWRTGNFFDVSDRLISICLFPIKLFCRTKLQAFQHDQDVKIAEVCTLLLGDFPENLFRAMDEDVPAPQAVVLMTYEECRQMALKASSDLSSSCYQPVHVYTC